MSHIYHYFGALFDNYAIFIIVLVLVTRLVTIPLSKMSKKQNAEKQNRKQVYKKLEEETNGNKEELTNKIYKYYKESDFNPWKSFFSKFIIFALNMAIVFSIIGCFSPLTNFSNIPKADVEKIVTVYTQEIETKRYPQISMLDNIDKTVEVLEKNNISYDYINEIKTIKEKFMLGRLDTTQIPKGSNNSFVKWLPVLVSLLLIMRCLVSIMTIVRVTKDENQRLISLASVVPSTVLSVIMTISIAGFTPVIVCFYLMILYLFGLIQSFIRFTRKEIVQIEKGELQVEAETNSEISEINSTDTLRENV